MPDMGAVSACPDKSCRAALRRLKTLLLPKRLAQRSCSAVHRSKRLHRCMTPAEATAPAAPQAAVQDSLTFYICQRLTSQRWKHVHFELSGATVQVEPGPRHVVPGCLLQTFTVATLMSRSLPGVAV